MFFCLLALSILISPNAAVFAENGTTVDGRCICQDGSLVEKFGPNCEFAPCNGGVKIPTVTSSDMPTVIDRPSIKSGVMCTMEMKTCADGSLVGRAGPNCEFMPCLGGVDGRGVSAPGMPTLTNKAPLEIKARIASTTMNLEKSSLELKKRLASTSEEVRARVEVREAKIEKAKQQTEDTLKKKSELMTAQYENVMAKFDNAQLKIEEAIKKMEGKGFDMTAIKENFVLAQENVDAVQNQMTDIQSILDKTNISSSTVKSVVQSIKTQNEALKATIKKAHSSLVDVLNAMKNEVKNANKTKATSTKATTE